MSKEDILNAISEMSVMEIVELIEALEEKFGVTAAAAVAAAPAAAGGAAGNQEAGGGKAHAVAPYGRLALVGLGDEVFQVTLPAAVEVVVATIGCVTVAQEAKINRALA